MLRIKSRKLPGEVFVEFENKYALSNLGRWYSATTKKIMRQARNSSGYYRVCLFIDGKRKWVFTHINVVKLFGDCKGQTIPENTTSLIKNGYSIDHIDRIKKNNYSTNLELVNHK